MFHTIKTQLMRLQHNIHTPPQLNIMTPAQERMIILLTIATPLFSQELLTDSRNLMITITVISSGAESTEDLLRSSVFREQQCVRWGVLT